VTVFEVDVPLRWADLDAQGHVNNALVVDYLQEARVGALLRSPNAGILGSGIVVVEHKVDYLAPISYDAEPLRARLRIGRVRAASFVYDYDLAQRGRPVARARTSACLFDFATGAPRRMTAGERAWFESVAEPLEPLRGPGEYRVGETAHEHSFTVRWSDLDSYGHVNNVAFLTYVGEARVAFHRQLDPEALRTDGASEPRGMLLIARQDVRYLNQLEHRLEPYAVRTGIARVGTTSVTFAHEIIDPRLGKTFARAAAVLVHADASGRPIPVSDAVRAAAERWPAHHA